MPEQTRSMTDSQSRPDSHPISIIEADWSREALTQWWDPSRQLLLAIRGYQRAQQQRSLLNCLRAKLWVLRHRFWSVVCAADIPINCRLGGGLMLTHPNGVVIHPEAEVGVNCLILQQVTLVSGVKVGGNVDIGAGAKVIKPVTIGDRALIGANAVVTCDVRSGTTVVGIPAREI